VLFSLIGYSHVLVYSIGQGDYGLACSYYTESIDLYPDRVAPYSNRALCYLKTDNPGLAVKVGVLTQSADQ